MPAEHQAWNDTSECKIRLQRCAKTFFKAQNERTGLVDLVRAGGRAVRDGAVPASRTRATVQVCDLWFERAGVAAYLKARERHAA